MIRTLFHHLSPAIGIVEILGICTILGSIWRMIATKTNWITWILFAIAISLYLFIRYCASRRWYKNAEKYEGIELQFKKAMSPTVYIIFLGNLLFITYSSKIVLVIIVALLLIVVHVNFILLYLHTKDSSELTVNYFTHKKMDIEKT